MSGTCPTNLHLSLLKLFIIFDLCFAIEALTALFKFLACVCLKQYFDALSRVWFLFNYTVFRSFRFWVVFHLCFNYFFLCSNEILWEIYAAGAFSAAAARGATSSNKNKNTPGSTHSWNNFVYSANIFMLLALGNGGSDSSN